MTRAPRPCPRCSKETVGGVSVKYRDGKKWAGGALDTRYCVSCDETTSVIEAEMRIEQLEAKNRAAAVEIARLRHERDTLAAAAAARLVPNNVPTNGPNGPVAVPVKRDVPTNVPTNGDLVTCGTCGREGVRLVADAKRAGVLILERHSKPGSKAKCYAGGWPPFSAVRRTTAAAAPASGRTSA